MPRIGRPSPALVISLVALVVASSGTAVGAARHLIGGADIRNGSVTGKDIHNHSITAADVRTRSLLAKDFKRGQLPAPVDTSQFLTTQAGDVRYLGAHAPAGGDLTGTFPAPTVANGAINGAKVADKSLTLSDLGGSRPAEMTTTTSAAITINAGQCIAQLTGNFGDGVVGDLVVGTLTDANGNAVLPNSAAFVPSVVIKTSQGGAVPNLVVCNTGTGAAETIPAGSVFHWRLIDA